MEEILTNAVNSATDAVYVAKHRMNTLIADIPSGLPASDSQLRMKQASDAHLAALGKLREALRRWNDYAMHGKAPQDLTDEGRSGDSGFGRGDSFRDA
jgi:hypothetical protein